MKRYFYEIIKTIIIVGAIFLFINGIDHPLKVEAEELAMTETVVSEPVQGGLPTYVQAQIPTNVFQQPTPEAPILGTLQVGQLAIVYQSIGGAWYEIYYMGQVAYVTIADVIAFNGADGVVKKLDLQAYLQPPIINALGDSIVYGDGLKNREVSFISLLSKKIKNATLNNYGLCGSALSGNNPDRLLDRYSSMAKDANIIFVMGGTNDYGYGVPLGTFGDKTADTFYGGLNLLMCGLNQMYPESTIVFLTPIKRKGGETPNALGFRLSDYVNAVINMGSFYGIQVENLYTVSKLDFSYRTKRYMPDGLHPNARGHSVIANYIYKQLQ